MLYFENCTQTDFSSHFPQTVGRSIVITARRRLLNTRRSINFIGPTGLVMGKQRLEWQHCQS